MNYLTAALVLLSSLAQCQHVGAALGKHVDASGKYLFYLHGGVVTVLGNNAINQSVPEWGPYEYRNILDSLRRRGFNVISENRKAGVDDSVYAGRIARQIDTLFRGGVERRNILVVGASAGWNIAMQVSAKVKDPTLKYVMMGGCWPETYKEYERTDLYGHFLSIIEATDPHGTCAKIFEGKRNVTSHREITLHTGLSHGFIYKGHREWIDPAVEWFNRR